MLRNNEQERDCFKFTQNHTLAFASLAFSRISVEYKETILIADGDPLGRETLKALLLSQGYELAFAHNGPDAIDRVRQIEPDLLLLDAMLPVVDGFDVCNRLRSDPDVSETPIIMVTSLDDNASRLRGLEMGIDDFITKPFDMAQLRARVRTITRLNRQRRLRTLELQSERDRTRAILEALGEAVIVTDMDGTIEYINPTAASLTGYSRTEAVGHEWGTLHGEDTRAKLQDILQDVQKGHTWRGEVISTRKDGSTFDAALTVAPLHSSSEPGRVEGFVSVQRDITPLKEAQRAKDAFVSNVSHELRTPLSVITLIGDNLNTLYDRLNESRRRKMINDIQKHSQALEDLIEDVLVLSRIDSRRVTAEQDQLDLSVLAREETDKLQPLAQEKSHNLSVSADETVMVRGNAGQLRQAIRNLVNNAIKYTEADGTIACTCQLLTKVADEGNAEWPNFGALPHGKWVGFRVADDGIGISKEHLPYLFERFYRVKAQQKIRGTGLGLAITQELIELHSGHIAVNSSPGQGSTFAFYLPLLEEV